MYIPARLGLHKMSFQYCLRAFKFNISLIGRACCLPNSSPCKFQEPVKKFQREISNASAGQILYLRDNILCSKRRRVNRKCHKRSVSLTKTVHYKEHKLFAKTSFGRQFLVMRRSVTMTSLCTSEMTSFSQNYVKLTFLKQNVKNA